MIELLRDRDYTVVGYYQSILESEGVRTFVKNERPRALFDPKFVPALFVINDEDHDRAMAILRDYSTPDPAALASADWTCPACQESNPGTFDLCWSCESPREESTVL